MWEVVSKERYIAESLFLEAERDFERARADVRGAARAYEVCRDRGPLSKWTREARSAWNLNVMEWIAATVRLEEALERVLLLEQVDGSGMAPSAGRHDMAGVEAHFGGTPPVREIIRNLDRVLEERVHRTGETFESATEKVQKCRAVTDRAFAVYREKRLGVSPEEREALREAWRSSLVVWSQALRDRETAREKALAALRRADWHLAGVEGESGASLSPHAGDYEPEEDALF
ncbi:hypothetical protein [Actinomadura oligospora]|uniref:hypothetical protein n=1 Tax=Actinomadura oligospora TaxID=111804 RepID=UPI00047C3D9E|nr:hypothetical protein [Actinomadura oligospora]